VLHRAGSGVAQIRPAGPSRLPRARHLDHLNDVSRYRQLQNELEAANRQLETAYEELQSTNEELETMNEELQSMNDELLVTNDELRDRPTEISALNHFMESVLGSLGAGVVVVSREMIVQVWNRQAEDLWGLREDETVGQHFLNLDTGLPSERLKPLVRDVIFEGSTGGEVAVRAVNRRGRPIELRVAVTPLMSGDSVPSGALLLIEPHEVSEVGRQR
jgi:two-component system, chemotaxis family, CheB/CheR fusion protein